VDALYIALVLFLFVLSVGLIALFDRIR